MLSIWNVASRTNITIITTDAQGISSSNYIYFYAIVEGKKQLPTRRALRSVWFDLFVGRHWNDAVENAVRTYLWDRFHNITTSVLVGGLWLRNKDQNQIIVSDPDHHKYHSILIVISSNPHDDGLNFDSNFVVESVWASIPIVLDVDSNAIDLRRLQ